MLTRHYQKCSAITQDQTSLCGRSGNSQGSVPHFSIFECAQIPIRMYTRYSHEIENKGKKMGNKNRSKSKAILLLRERQQQNYFLEGTFSFIMIFPFAKKYNGIEQLSGTLRYFCISNTTQSINVKLLTILCERSLQELIFYLDWK